MENFKLKHEMIPIAQIEINNGQIDGLPSNPRQWTKTEIDRLKKSIKETPELLAVRSLMVIRHGDIYVTIGGNMRLSALREMHETIAPCVVIPEDTPVNKLRELVIKDNGTFGEWDVDLLANEWDDISLVDWGVPAWEQPDTTNDEMPADLDAESMKENPYVVKITFQNVNDIERFMSLYRDIVLKDFNATMSVTGGEL